MPVETRQPELRRSVPLSLLVLYGLGTTVGAGIYALTGKIAGEAGTWTPAAFLLASLIAAFTGLCFANLASRYPRSAGEAVYLQAGFQLRRLAQLGGLLVVLSGITSSATLARAAFGYASELWALPEFLSLAVLLGSISLLVIAGIRESVGVAALLTVLEVGGILLVTAVGSHFLFESGAPVVSSDGAGLIPVAGILSGAVLGFYAFIGFEDMVNVAEEVTHPERNLPLGIVLTLGITVVLYISLALVAIHLVPPAELADSAAPLTYLYERAGGSWPWLINAIALSGLLNGILIQVIMASRVLYGLSREHAAPHWLGAVNPRTRTPIRATCLIGLAVLALCYSLPVERLARITSWTILVLFALVDWALVRVQKRADAPAASFRLPNWVPIVGAWLCAGMVLRELLWMFGGLS